MQNDPKKKNPTNKGNENRSYDKRNTPDRHTTQSESREESGSESSQKFTDQNQVVNEQEQNRAVNRSGEDFREGVTNKGKLYDDDKLQRDLQQAKKEDDDDGGEIETPHKKSDGDADSTERKIPNM